MSLYSWLSNHHKAPLAWRVAGFSLMASAFGLLWALKTLPYSSVRLMPVEASEATRRPTPDFTLGPLTWPVGEFAATPALRPFRDSMRATCGQAKGVAAAECATTALSERSPLGNPASEFVNVDFDPVAHLERHMAGAPGHCLTRSAILATQLLAVGIPARVVQMIPARAKGHTLVEVWDDTKGWTVVDPSTGGFVSGTGPRGSAGELLADPASVQWKPFGSAPVSAAESEAKKRHFQTLLGGNLLYPEPWLYLRQGERVAPWPLRGHYARVGPVFLMLGPVQRVLAWAVPALAVTGLAFLAVGWRRRHARVRAEGASRVHGAVDALDGLDVPQRT